MYDSRDRHLLILVAAIGLMIGGLSGVIGGVLVTTGTVEPLLRYILPITLPRDDDGDADAPRVPLAGDEESLTVAAVRRATPSVVSIVVRKEISTARGNFFNLDDFFEFGIPFAPPRGRSGEPGGAGSGSAGKQQVGGGSGFIVTSDGYILTNRHVVLDPDAEYAVVLHNDRELAARVVDTDPIHDIAILKIESADPLPVLALGDSDQLAIGETVIAIGYALSEFKNTVTKGVVSGVNRRVVAGNGSGLSEVIQEAIQTDAAINPGNSGGPLLNLRGEAIGVNTAVSREGQLVGFAIPINVAKQAIASVVAEGHIVRPWLGVRYIMVTPTIVAEEDLSTDHGALIARGADQGTAAIVPDSPADKAGLKIGDLITAVDGARVDDDHPLVTHIAKHVAGDRITLTVIRDGKERMVEVDLGEFPGK